MTFNDKLPGLKSEKRNLVGLDMNLESQEILSDVSEVQVDLGSTDNSDYMQYSTSGDTNISLGSLHGSVLSQMREQKRGEHPHLSEHISNYARSTIVEEEKVTFLENQGVQYKVAIFPTNAQNILGFYVGRQEDRSNHNISLLSESDISQLSNISNPEDWNGVKSVDQPEDYYSRGVFGVINLEGNGEGRVSIEFKENLPANIDRFDLVHLLGQGFLRL